jgi:predicted nucleotidyltransferase
MFTLNKDSIFQELSEHKEKLRGFGVCKLGLFGSFVDDTQTDDSDIDFLVEFEEGKKTFDNYMELKFFFEEIFHRKIDLVTPKSIKPFLKESILKTVQYAA